MIVCPVCQTNKVAKGQWKDLEVFEAGEEILGDTEFFTVVDGYSCENAHLFFLQSTRRNV